MSKILAHRSTPGKPGLRASQNRFQSVVVCIRCACHMEERDEADAPDSEAPITPLRHSVLA
ncbi:MAG: hypothetical protein GY875_13300 [Gammaproteobacteria bacterium]|nr:hypothetical protein [Gammaproteobacteria bacterium]